MAKLKATIAGYCEESRKEDANLHALQRPNFTALVTEVTELKVIVSKNQNKIVDKLNMLITVIQQ